MIRAAASAGLTVKEIAYAAGADPRTVRKALSPEAPLTYHRPRLADGPLGDQVRSVLSQYPRMKAPAVAYRLGYTGPMSTLRLVISQVRDTSGGA